MRGALGLGLAVLATVPVPAAVPPGGPPPPPPVAAGVELRPLPEVRAEDLAEGDRRQVLEQRERVEGLLRRDAPRAELASAYGRLGQLFYVYDFLDAAVAAFGNARALAPDEFAWRYYLGAIHAADGRLDRAQAELTRAAELRPEDLPTRIRLGELALDRGELESARRQFTKALELDPESAAAHDGLGKVAYDEGDVDGAIRHHRRALELQPQADAVHHRLGLAYRKAGDLERAREHLALNRGRAVAFPDPLVSRLSDLVQGADALVKAGNAAMERGDLDAALEHYRGALEIAPDDPLTWYNAGFVLARQGEAEEAIRHFRKALEIDPEYRNAHYNLGAALERRGELEAALRHYREAYRIDPEDHRAHLEWAGLLARTGRSDAAARELADVLEAAPPFATDVRARAHLELGRLAEAQGDAAAAEERYRRALERAPGLPAANRALAGVLGRRERFGEAAEHLDRVVEAVPEDVDARFGRATARMLAGRYAAARRDLERDVEELPQALPLAHALARLLATCPDPGVRDGERALELALAVFRAEESLEHGQTVAMAYAELGDYRRAVNWQRQVLALLQGSGREDAIREARRRLGRYEAGRPVRAPWSHG